MWKGTAPSGLLADLVVGYLRPRHVGPVHGGKMHFPTVREFMAHGQWRPAFPTKLPVTLSFPLAPPPRARPPTTRRSTRCTSFPSAPASMISLLCLGKRVAQCAPRRLNPRGRPFLRAVGIPEANLRGTLDRHDHPG
jgi:hypothetical protein